MEASVSLPGTPDITGLWPAFWTMGNLGRASYGSTLEGMWYVRCSAFVHDRRAIKRSIANMYSSFTFYTVLYRY